MLEQLGNQNSKRQVQKTTLFLFGQQNYHLCHCLYCPHLIGTCNAGWPELIGSYSQEMNQPAMQETPVQFLGQGDPLEKG